MFNFNEDVSLLETARAAVMVQNGFELETWIDRILRDETEMARLGSAARDVVSKAKGATERNFELIDRLFLKEFVQKER